jgi:hypothetical protein
MKFSALNPQMTGTSDLGDGEAKNELTFDCPKCGPPYRISIHCHQGEPDAARALWKWAMPPGVNDWDRITIDPSISNHHHGRKPCGYHLSVINGEVVP